MDLSTIAENLINTAYSYLLDGMLPVANWAGSSIVENLINTAYSYLLDGMLPVASEAELKRLKAALPQITAVMGIAETLKMKHPSASSWVDQFRQAVEASEDVLDELEYKKLEDMVKNGDEAEDSASSSKKRKLCTTNDSLERLKEAITMLNRATDGVEDLLQLVNFNSLSESGQEVSEVLKRQTTSFLAENEVFGREVEKTEIIDWLKRPTDAHLSSLSIVGVGGQGKTTLAQLAYQEMLKEKQFDKTIWVCVSTNFSVEEVTSKMLSKTNCGKPLNELQESLKDMVLSKKILLVLDDVWDDKRRCDWEQLIAPLKFVQQGSKIILTTRMKSVAELLASVINTEDKSLALEGLGEQELRLLFYSYAFRGFNPDNHRELQIVADQILKLLRRSPLAAKVIGSLLNSRMDQKYWRNCLNHGSLFNLEQAEDVMGVLKLSYYHLPECLQVCFRFCSIFPQDHWFDKDDLIKMWICSGFIRQQSSQEERPEDIGEDYFNLLLRKSFFEYVESWWFGRRYVYYVMHDLMHELAQNVSYGECHRIEPNDKSITIPNTVRHVYVHECEIEKVSHLENLRSLVVTTYDGFTHPYSFVLPNNLIKKNLSLRLLKICGSGNRNSEMPKEISCLVHLRYLSAGGPRPYYVIDETFKYLLLASVYKLYHLQVLEIPGDNEVAINSAIETTGVTNLLRLRYMRLPKESMQTIQGVHKLTSLQELTFFVGQESGQRINELSTLKNLQRLFIENIENIGDHTEAKSANLLEKNNLKSLSLKWNSKSNPIHPEKIIDCLQPPPTLEELTIKNYNGPRSPNWMADSPCLYLSTLKLFNCPLWENQLFSGKIPYLKILDIRDCLNLDKVPDMPLSLIELRINNMGLTSLPALYQNSDNNTPAPLSLKSSLRVVKIGRCPKLISLHGFLQQDNVDFQSIEKIEVNNCRNLIHLPIGGFGKFVSLKKLTIRGCPMLMAVDNQSNLLPKNLETLSIRNCGKLDVPLLESASTLATVAHLLMHSCANISHIPSSENVFGSLSSLTIHGCDKLIEHSSKIQAHDVNQGSNLASLKISYLDIDGLSLLFIEPLRSLRFVSRLIVSNCSTMETLPEQWLLQNSSTLTSLSIHGCDKLLEHSSKIQAHDVNQGSNLASLKISHLDIDGLSLLFIEPLRSLRFVSRLIVSNCSAMETLPEQWLLQNSSTLTSLSISNASTLKSLPATMVSLTSLKTLEIWKADLLQELPEFPASLKEKYINGRGVNSLIKTLSRSYSSEIAFNPPSSLIIDGCDKPIDHSFSEKAHGVSTSADWAGSFWQIANLQILDLHNFVTLDRLPDMPLSLIEFQVHNVGLTSLPDLYQSSDSRGSPSASSLKSSLRKVRISNCQNLTSLNGFLQQDNDFQFIEHIEVTNCRNLVHLPVGAFGKFVSLQALTISNCPMLTAADNHSNLLPMALKDLSIENCGEIDEPLLKSVSSLATLTFLSINNCANILRISLGNAVRSLSSLRMNAYDKPVEHSSRKQPHGVSQGSNLSSLILSRLEIDHLSLLLIEPLRSLRSVRYLRVWSCSGMEALPEQWFWQNSSTLSWLSIRNASTLKSLLATMERLSSLQWLEIWQADLLRELPELPTSLRSLVIRDASSLRSLPATMARLSVLEWLEIWKANLLEELPELPASLKQKYIEGRGVTSQFGTFPRSYLSLARV